MTGSGPLYHHNRMDVISSTTDDNINNTVPGYPDSSTPALSLQENSSQVNSRHESHHEVERSECPKSPIPEFFPSIEDDLLLTALNELSVSTSAYSTPAPPPSCGLEDELDALAAVECVNKDDVAVCLEQLATSCAVATGPVKVPEPSADIPKACDFSVLDSLWSSGNVDGKLDGVLSGMLTNDVLGEPMRALIAAYEPWLTQYAATNPPPEELHRFQSQYRHYRDILRLCEGPEDISKVQMLQTLMANLQQLDEPPQEVLNALFGSVASPQVGTSNDGSHADISTVTESLIKQFESALFGGRDENGGDVDDDDDDDDYVKDDIEGFTTFLKGLGLSGNGIDKFLDPEKLMKASAGDITEEQLTAMLIGASETDVKNVKPQNRPRQESDDASAAAAAVEYESSCRQM